MKRNHLLSLILLLPLFTFFLNTAPQPVSANSDPTAGVNILSVLPERVCVGDVITLSGAADVDYPDQPPKSDGTIPVVRLPVTRVDFSAKLGEVSPDHIIQYNDGFYFDFTYKATTPGSETVSVDLSNGMATSQVSFEVEEKCDYDAFYLSLMFFDANIEGENFSSLTHITGTGVLKRDRDGSSSYQGDGEWRFEEHVLSKPEDCVQYYFPPLIMHGPFKTEGLLTNDGESLDVKVNFLPRMGEPSYHGESVCIDKDGNAGYGAGIIQGGDPSLAARIEATFPAGGGSQSVELQGGGLDLVRSVGTVEYTAFLTLIPR